MGAPGMLPTKAPPCLRGAALVAGSDLIEDLLADLDEVRLAFVGWPFGWPHSDGPIRMAIAEQHDRGGRLRDEADPGEEARCSRPSG